MAGKTQTYYNNNPKAKAIKAKQQKKFNAKPEEKKKRSMRNAARRALERLGRVRKGDGKDVDHKDRNANNNSPSNLRVQSASRNRGRNQ
jgi:hypothetical protein